jgi:hypothetical protein
MSRKLPYKQKLDIIFLDFSKILLKKGFIKEGITLRDLFNVSDELQNTPGFTHFVHDFLCDECE